MTKLDSVLADGYYQQSFSVNRMHVCGLICPEFMIKLGKR